MLEQLVTPMSRVLDVGVRDPGVADALASAGAHRYLGLVLPRDRAVLDEVPARLEGRFHPLTQPDQVHRNNTDLLILRAPAARAVWGVRDLSHVSHVAVEVGSTSAWLETHGALALSRLLGRVQHLGVTAVGGTRFAVFETRRQRLLRPRHYLSEAVGVHGLIQRLEAEGLDYVVLRWFEDLPHLPPGEDLDLLVADRHLQRLHEILAEEPGTIPVDVYSETGLEGADYQGMAYYPPRLATQILQRATSHPSGARVPCPEDHLHSLAYHAVYHKGAASGLASGLTRTEASPDHDYAEALLSVARPMGRPFPLTLEEVDTVLEAHGWRPPLDTLRRLAPTNQWVQRAFFATAEDTDLELPEPAVFFVRDRALAALGQEKIMQLFEEFAFEVLLVRELTTQERERSAEHVRGGNWGSGPFPVSGGDPALLVFVAHYGPRRPVAALHARYPRLTNGDVLHLKVRMRELIEQTLGSKSSFNPVHSSDDEFEAWEYLSVPLPDEVDGLRRQVAQRRDDFRTDKEVLAVLSNGRRAKVEVVQDKAGRRVRKTFAPHAQRFLDREVRAMRDLASIGPEMPPLLATGPNWFEMPYFDNRLQGRYLRGTTGLVPLPLVRQMVDVLRRVHARGLDLIDAKPSNFLLDAAQGLKLVDLEFCQAYQQESPPFEDIYAFGGIPAHFDGDIPFGPISYDALWRPYTGLSRESLLHDPPWRQRLHRAAFRARLAGRYPLRAGRRGARGGLDLVRRGRTSAGAAYRQWARDRARVTV